MVTKGFLWFNGSCGHKIIWTFLFTIDALEPINSTEDITRTYSMTECDVPLTPMSTFDVILGVIWHRMSCRLGQSLGACGRTEVIAPTCHDSHSFARFRIFFLSRNYGVKWGSETLADCNDCTLEELVRAVSHQNKLFPQVASRNSSRISYSGQRERCQPIDFRLVLQLRSFFVSAVLVFSAKKLGTPSSNLFAMDLTGGLGMFWFVVVVSLSLLASSWSTCLRDDRSFLIVFIYQHNFQDLIDASICCTMMLFRTGGTFSTHVAEVIHC